MVSPAFAEAPKVTPAKGVVPPPKAVFTQPATAHDGRDPFFPESTRPFESVVAAHTTVEPTTLSVKGYSIVRGRPMVIINNHSFMVGDEGDVIATGGRAHVRCIEIKSGLVIIEVNGARHEIRF